MKAQFKYSLRAYLTPRAITLAAVLAMNLVFGILGYFDIYGSGWKITAVTLCSVALFAIFVLCVITDFEMLRNMCSAPAGYATVLAPVESWKIILPRVVTILVEDIILIAAGIMGVVVQSFILSGLSFDKFYSEDYGSLSFWGPSTIVLGYAYTILIVLFCIILSKSVFSSIKAGTFLAVLATAGVAYVFNLLNLVLAPFGAVESVGVFYNVQLIMSSNIGMITYLLLSLCKSAALFLTCAYLMERKINL